MKIKLRIRLDRKQRRIRTPYIKVYKVGYCVKCDQEKKIQANGLCFACYRVYRMKNFGKKVCLTCGEKKLILAKGKCKRCYYSTRSKEKKEHHIEKKKIYYFSGVIPGKIL